jgi:hypothetical protein
MSVPSSATLAQARANARSCDTPQGRRLNVSAIVVRFNVQPWVFRSRQRKGWPAPDGGRVWLNPVPMPIPNDAAQGGLTEPTYLEAEVAAVLRQGPQLPLAPGWVDESTYRDEAGAWLTLEGVRDKHRLPVRSVRRWADPDGSGCRFLEGGRPLRSQMVNPARPRARGRVLVALESDVLALKDKRLPGGPAVPYRDGDGVWLTAKEVEARYPVTRRLVQWWAGRPSRLHPGKAIWSRPIPNAARHRRGSPGRVTVYLEAHVQACVAGRESRHPNTGNRGGRPRVSREEPGAPAVRPVPAPPDGDARQRTAAPGKRRLGGRPRSRSTEALEKFCYDFYVGKGLTAAAVLTKAAKQFEDAPKEEAHVRLYARRYAERHGLPRNRPAPSKR